MRCEQRKGGKGEEEKDVVGDRIIGREYRRLADWKSERATITKPALNNFFGYLFCPTNTTYGNAICSQLHWLCSLHHQRINSHIAHLSMANTLDMSSLQEKHKVFAGNPQTPHKSHTPRRKPANSHNHYENGVSRSLLKSTHAIELTRALHCQLMLVCGGDGLLCNNMTSYMLTSRNKVTSETGRSCCHP